MSTETKSAFLNTLSERGFLSACTDLAGLDAELEAGPVTAYIGYDATAPSLHIGHLLNIRVLRLLQACGGRPIVLMGGGTTRVGDPSFRNTERPLLGPEVIAGNIANMSKVFATQLRFEGENAAIMADNADWLCDLNYLDFMRDVGRHFTVSRMLSFDSVRTRLEDGGSLSFLEFGYMILQAYDFLALKERHGCTLQIGGSDQWGNIVNGIELVRKMRGERVTGLTTTLLTNSAGKKMGKTGNGAVWLDRGKMPAWDFWQFWRNVDDADVGRFLKLFTDLPVAECDLMGRTGGAEINAAKIRLASLVTASVHGQAAAESAEQTARELFGAGRATGEIPVFHLSFFDGPGTLAKLLVHVGMADSGKDAKRKLREGAVRIDGQKVTDPDAIVADWSGDVRLSVGQKNNALIRC